ncbi:tandem-95 repeat protein [Microcoleus sp. FACHB-SPT15]|uniref:tandem-95 repeat protein n=1 Tax=Microcoleus sp. FACHB-SPT15 TaxID=2692830 RepID=UPI0017837BA9|nr:tandem-95 repeat protein [Microcoleus sp. FACHB-SPT15]MBD1809821.1 tandem-95 repeat protein [Microcoleus sp. FACHB-SPT15]
MSIVPIGSEFRVNTYTSSEQRTFTETPQSVAMDADGDFVVTWSSNGQDGSGWGVYVQRYNATGQALGNEFRVNTITSNSQQFSTVAMDADGDFVVTWSSNGQDGSGWGVYAQRYNAVGEAIGDQFRVNSYTSGSQEFSTVAMDADGDFVVTWSSSGQDGSGWGVYAQRYNAAGEALGNEFRVNSYTSGSQIYSKVAMDADGDFVVIWNSAAQDGSSYGVYAQRYSAAGEALGGEFKVNTYTSNTQRFSSIAMDADGDFVVTWSSSGQDGSGWGVYAQRYSAAGEALGQEFRVNSYTSGSQLYSTVAMDADGDFVITWSSNAQDGSGYGVYAQRYNAAGEAIGDEFQVNTYTNNSQRFSNVAMDADGDFIVNWTSPGQDGSSYGVYAQLYRELEAPTSTGISNVIVQEDAPNTVIDLFAAFTDDDDTDTNLTYTIANNSNPSLFVATTVDAVTGELILDYATNANGTGNLTIRATDSDGLSVETTFDVTVTAVNDTPTVVNSIPNQSAAEDVPFSFLLPANTFSDVDAGSSLAYTATLSNGNALPSWLIFNAATRAFSGTPLNGMVGSLDIRVTATDEVGANVSDTFNLAIANTNYAPITNDEVATLTEGNSITLDVLANATDADGDALTIESFTSPTYGTLVQNEEGTFTYIAPLNFSGADNFTYTVSDGYGGTSELTTVSLTVDPLNLEGTAASETLTGTTSDNIINAYGGNDVIEGNAGNDTVSAGRGHDLLIGGSGADFLVGGAGNDMFVYIDFNDKGDIIADFSISRDSLGLTSLFDNLGYTGANPIAAGYMRFVQSGTDTQVQIDPDGVAGSQNFSSLVTLNNVTTTALIIGSNVIV